MKLSIRDALHKRNIKQSQLADGLEISRGYVSGLVSGTKTPSTEMLLRIADFLSMSPAELFDEIENAASQPSGLQGFAEGAEAFVLPPEKVKAIYAKASAEPVTGKHITTLQVAVAIPALYLMNGDLINLDMRRKTDYGSLAAVTRADLNTGTGRTLIRRIEQGYIASPNPMLRDEKWQSSDHNYAVMGRVVSVFREM